MMKYSNDAKKVGQASAGLTNTIGYPNTAEKGGKGFDSGIFSGVGDEGADMVTPMPAKKNAGPGWNGSVWSDVNFSGRP